MHSLTPIKRKSTRYGTNQESILQAVGKEGAARCKVINLSVTGACLDSGKLHLAIKKSDLIMLTILVPVLNRRYLMGGELIWKRGNLAGIKFVGADRIRERLIQKGRKLN